MEEMKGFRCPECGQAHEMIVKDSKFTMNKEMTELKINGEPFFDGAGIDGDQDVTCGECEGTHDIQNWILAFKEPLRFFETEQLCHCGGELWMDQIPGTRNYGFVCDDCNWVKPKAVVSGA